MASSRLLHSRGPPPTLHPTHHKWSLGAARGAVSRLDLILCVLWEGAQHVAALEAVILDQAKLGEHARAPGHHASHADKGVEVVIPGGGEGGGARAPRGC